MKITENDNHMIFLWNMCLDQQLGSLDNYCNQIILQLECLQSSNSRGEAPNAKRAHACSLLKRKDRKDRAAAMTAAIQRIQLRFFDPHEVSCICMCTVILYCISMSISLYIYIIWIYLSIFGRLIDLFQG